MKVLDLFCGTKSVSRAFEARGHEVYTVDWEKGFSPTLCADIGTLTAADIINLCGGVPDVIWASPDCTTYSVQAISHHRRREANGNLAAVTDYARTCDRINAHLIDLIRELNPKYYFIENPRAGMRKMDFMQGLPRYTVTYCQYADELVQELIFNMESKKCPKCGLIKDIGEFYKNKSRRDGFSCYCKQCTSEDAHKYHEENKELCKERLNKWRKENAEYVRIRDKKYREENPDIEFERQRRYRETHKERLHLKGQQYREEHRDYFYNKARERKLAQQAVSDGTVTLEYEQYLYDEQQGKCAYCGCDLSESGKHLDHIIPIAKGGKHTANNVHWTCPTCNLSKGDKLEEEWLRKSRCKPTDIWSNHPAPKFKPACKNGDTCHEAAPRGSQTGTQGSHNKIDKARIPKLLCEHIVDICEEGSDAIHC